MHRIIRGKDRPPIPTRAIEERCQSIQAAIGTMRSALGQIAVDIEVDGGQHFKESDTFSKGESPTLFDTPWGSMGVCICFDIRFPLFIREYCELGAKALIVPAAFNMTTGPMHWELLFRSRAVDNQFFTFGCAPARDEKGGYVSYANSIAVDPWGHIISRADEKECILTAEVDLSLCQSVRRQIPVLGQK